MPACNKDLPKLQDKEVAGAENVEGSRKVRFGHSTVLREEGYHTHRMPSNAAILEACARFVDVTAGAFEYDFRLFSILQKERPFSLSTSSSSITKQPARQETNG